jgi:hypothetical protein
MLKSIRIEPKPQPPAPFSAPMMVSDCVLFGSVDTSVFHGLGASKSRPESVVVVTAVVVVVLGRDVELELLDDEVVLELVVGGRVVVGSRVDDVLVVDVEVVVVRFFRASVVVPSLVHTHAAHVSPPAQSSAVSHCSPASGSSRPSPQS